ncbi:MAG: UDP-3-O-[3-hydroxymyristoyl] N-acetylglucosamine deacetylase, partial [Candidatus Omnitrophica bacterium]|nr:UDP-3-O-[3-hydroxymyristoyl] N-acetylglucosamine deacetylase [Candidatus Omnitrophota bacterium]
MDMQRTINSKISFEGVGLHTGNNSKIEILPANPNTGVIFVRKDLEEQVLIKADFYALLDPDNFPRRTSIGSKDVYVHTVEHLMAAFHLLGIDNVQINIWGEEIPGLDGSSKEFIDKINEIGWTEQATKRSRLIVKEPLWVEDGSASIFVLPYKGLRISYVLDYDSDLIPAGYKDIILNGTLNDPFYEARTFCLEKEVKPLLDMGLGKGANYKNTLVVSEKGIVENELRFPDEFVKHKILDLIGDLYISGPISGHVIAVKG